MGSYLLRIEVAMPRIIPIKELKNTSEISSLCHSVQEPIFITKNGYGDMVIMDIDLYEERFYLASIYEKLSEAERQVKEGKVRDAEESLRLIREKYAV
jgi:PHD/YefM family antitoxin component YafN of YafNO toxin-antitoxin module